MLPVNVARPLTLSTAATTAVTSLCNGVESLQVAFTTPAAGVVSW